MRGLSTGQESEDWLKAAIQAEHTKVQAMLAEGHRRSSAAHLALLKARGQEKGPAEDMWRALHSLELKLYEIARGE